MDQNPNDNLFFNSEPSKQPEPPKQPEPFSAGEPAPVSGSEPIYPPTPGFANRLRSAGANPSILPRPGSKQLGRSHSRRPHPLQRPCLGTNSPPSRSIRRPLPSRPRTTAPSGSSSSLWWFCCAAAAWGLPSGMPGRTATSGSRITARSCRWSSRIWPDLTDFITAYIGSIGRLSAA